MHIILHGWLDQYFQMTFRRLVFQKKKLDIELDDLFNAPLK